MQNQYKIKHNQPLILIIIALITLILFYFIQNYIFSQNLISTQTSIHQFISAIQSKPLNAVIIFITNSGNYIPITLLTIIITILLFKYYYKIEAVFFIFNSLLLILTNSVVKNFFQRERPTFNRLVEADGYSFPSGHAMVNLGIAIFIGYLIFKIIEYKRAAIILSGIIFFYAILIGLSRVYVGVHYLGDVMGGWLLGCTVSCFVLAIYELVKNHHLNKNIYYRRQ